MDCTPQEWRDFCTNKLKFITEQVEPRSFFPSVITLNSRGLLDRTGKRSKSLFPGASSSTLKIVHEPRSTVHPRSSLETTWLQMRGSMLYSHMETGHREEPLEEEKLEEEERKAGSVAATMVEEKEEEKKQREAKEIAVLQARLEELRTSIRAVTEQTVKTRERCKEEEVEARGKMKEAEARKKALSLIEEREANLGKLKEAVDAASQRLIALAKEWERRRRPLIEKYRQARKSMLDRATESEKEMERVGELKEKLVSLNKEISVKQSVRVKLEEEYEKLPKDINRSAYTRRIMEIIGNIKKQKEEIERILKDTKEIQKYINSDTGKLDRSFTVTEEAIYRDTKKDESSRRAYKLLITLHSDCSDIVSMVEETGSIVREIRVLEEQIDIEKSKDVSANLERIKADLQQMKLESDTLRTQLNHQKNM